MRAAQLFVETLQKLQLLDDSSSSELRHVEASINDLKSLVRDAVDIWVNTSEDGNRRTLLKSLLRKSKNAITGTAQVPLPALVSPQGVWMNMVA